MSQGIRIKALLRATLSSWIEHRSASKSAALAFYTLFSITPILVFAIAIAGNFFAADAARGELYVHLARLVTPDGAATILALLPAASDADTRPATTLIASLVLVFAATSVFTEIKGSLDQIWGLDQPPGSILRLLFKTRLLAIGLALALSFLLLASLLVSALLAVVMAYSDGLPGISSRWLTPILPALSFAVIASLLAVLNKILPDARLSWGDVWMGALCTAALFSLGNLLIGLYIGHSGVASHFGAAGSLVALLLWIYYSAMIFFMGAEFTRHYALAFGSLRPAPGTDTES
jgi:membrane protein